MAAITNPSNNSERSIVETRKDHKRCDGWRKPGGLYLIADRLGAPYRRCPRALTVCPVCGAGVKQSPGWQWFEPAEFFPCEKDGPDCETCPLKDPDPRTRSGLIWISKLHFPTTSKFRSEAEQWGVRVRINHKPKGLELGKTRVFLAHPTACIRQTDFAPRRGLFASFIPTAIEYVVKGDESPEALERMTKNGITPVHAERIEAESTFATVTV